MKNKLEDLSKFLKKNSLLNEAAFLSRILDKNEINLTKEAGAIYAPPKMLEACRQCYAYSAHYVMKRCSIRYFENVRRDIDILKHEMNKFTNRLSSLRDGDAKTAFSLHCKFPKSYGTYSQFPSANLHPEFYKEFKIFVGATSLFSKDYIQRLGTSAASESKPFVTFIEVDGTIEAYDFYQNIEEVKGSALVAYNLKLYKDCLNKDVDYCVQKRDSLDAIVLPDVAKYKPVGHASFKFNETSSGSFQVSGRLNFEIPIDLDGWRNIKSLNNSGRGGADAPNAIGLIFKYTDDATYLGLYQHDYDEPWIFININEEIYRASMHSGVKSLDRKKDANIEHTMEHELVHFAQHLIIKDPSLLSGPSADTHYDSNGLLKEREYKPDDKLKKEINPNTGEEEWYIDLFERIWFPSNADLENEPGVKERLGRKRFDPISKEYKPSIKIYEKHWLGKTKPSDKELETLKTKGDAGGFRQRHELRDIEYKPRLADSFNDFRYIVANLFLPDDLYPYLLAAFTAKRNYSYVYDKAKIMYKNDKALLDRLVWSECFEVDPWFKYMKGSNPKLYEKAVRDLSNLVYKDLLL